MKYLNVRDLVTSVVASAIIITMIACGGAAGVLPNVPGMPSAATIKHLVSLPTSGNVIAGHSTRPFMAALFQVQSPAPSQVPQSFDVQCSIIPGLSVPAGFLVPIPSPLQGADSCNQSVSDPAPIDTGKLTVTDGTLSSLVVTGSTDSGAKFQCRDLTSTLPIVDNSRTQAYLDPNAHKVLIENQAVSGTPTAAPFVCDGIGTDTDPVSSIDVQWVKE